MKSLNKNTYKVLAVSVICFSVCFFLRGKGPVAGGAKGESGESRLGHAVVSSGHIYEEAGAELPREVEGAMRGEMRGGSRADGSAGGLARFSSTAVLGSLPPGLHAKSAIELEVAEDGVVRGFLASAAESFSFPVAEGSLLDLRVTNTVRRGEGDVVIFGTVDTAKRSHFKMIFKDDALTSGAITFFDSGDQYLIRSLDDGRTITALVDPDIDIQQCGCSSCAH